MAPPTSRAAAAPPDPPPLARLYRLVMTPVLFVSFLFSLAWVEFMYTLRRRRHAHVPGDATLPPWLHRILYRPDKNQGAQDHYHSMQRKLLKMETAEAFRIRSTVLAVLGLLLAGAAWVAAGLLASLAAWLLR